MGEFSKDVTKTHRGLQKPTGVGGTQFHNWVEIFDEIKLPGAEVRELANAWIIRFPSGSGTFECSAFAKRFTDYDTRKTTQENMMTVVQEVDRTAGSFNMHRA